MAKRAFEQVSLQFVKQIRLQFCPWEKSAKETRLALTINKIRHFWQAGVCIGSLVYQTQTMLNIIFRIIGTYVSCYVVFIDEDGVYSVSGIGLVLLSCMFDSCKTW